jgi:hypothetical protein
MFPPHSSVANVCGNSGGNRSEKPDRPYKRYEYYQVNNIPEEQWAAITSDSHLYADEA